METVISCSKTKEWNGKPIYSVAFSDGRGGESFAVEIPVGTPVSDLIIEESQWGLKIKKKSTGGGGFQKQRSGNESFALSYAKDLVVGGKVDMKQILPVADKLYAWLEGKKGAAPAQSAASIPQKQEPVLDYKQTGSTDDLPF